MRDDFVNRALATFADFFHDTIMEEELPDHVEERPNWLFRAARIMPKQGRSKYTKKHK
jgi:hypothetical protein